MNEPDDNHAGRPPDSIAYDVREGRDGKSHWSRVGASWEHDDGQGRTIDLDSFPRSGKVVLRDVREDRMQEMAEQRAAAEPVMDNQRNRSRGRSR